MRGAADDLAAGALEHAQQPVVGADHGQPQGLLRIDDAIPFGVEPDRAAEDAFVVDTRVGPPVHELDAQRRRPLACQLPRARDDLGCDLLRIVPQAAKRRHRSRESAGRSPARPLEDGIDALVGDADVALDVGQRVSQCRRVERHEADQAIVANVVRRPELQAVAGIGQQHGCPLDQADIGGIGDPALGVGEVGPLQADLLQEAVERMAGAPQVVGNVDRPTGLDHQNAHDAVPNRRLPDRFDAKGQDSVGRSQGEGGRRCR